jgi:hypothetical protein
MTFHYESVLFGNIFPYKTISNSLKRDKKNRRIERSKGD